MLTKFMKWIASAALLAGLLLPTLLGRYAVGYHVGLLILIPAAATVVIFQAASMREYRWVAAFGVLACLFNPVVPFGFSAAPTLVVNNARACFVRTVAEAAENAATAFYCVYYGSHAGQRIVMRQSQPEGTVSFHHG